MYKVMKSVLISFFALVGSAQAVPMIYTFEGTVTQINDTWGILSAQGVSLGDSVAYTFLVDTELSATSTLNDGSVLTTADLSIRDYFYSDLLGDGMVDEVDGGIYNAPNHVAEYNVGFTELNYALTQFSGGSQDNYVSVTSYTNFSDMIAGLANVRGYEHARDNLGYPGSFYSTMTLTSIIEATSVPEPSAILLLGIGLVSFGVTQRLKKA